MIPNDFEPHGSSHYMSKTAIDILQLLCTFSSLQLDSFRSVRRMATVCLRAYIKSSWDVGTCFSDSILGQDGYLDCQQHHLRYLSLVTAGECYTSSVPLVVFSRLETLAWKGIRWAPQFDALNTFLVKYDLNVKSLELDFISSDDVERMEDAPWEPRLAQAQGFLRCMVRRRDDLFEPTLCYLERLSLTSGSFGGPLNSMFAFLNLHRVKHLRLINCKRTASLLLQIWKSQFNILASRVELVLTIPTRHPAEIWEFLLVLAEPKDLFILFSCVVPHVDLFQALYRYRFFMHRLTYHKREPRMVAIDTDTIQEWVDARCEDLLYPSLISLLRDALHLTALGICDKPSSLQSALQGNAKDFTTIKLLHLRFTGKSQPKPKFADEDDYGAGDTFFTQALHDLEPSTSIGLDLWPRDWIAEEAEELEEFADWAFSSEGFPNLKVLASGDFSHDGRYARSQAMWCRVEHLANEDNDRIKAGGRGDKGKGKEVIRAGSRICYRRMTGTEIRKDEFVQENMDMLASCPVTPYFLEYARKDRFPGVG
ncbi:uncharacterized protein KY384_000898 [Bacidia gigantensis]|uniref:uncharacterized protein n=1 Tax=Bacidia gigantensis TaxID=2732470 RepID=UPI001D059815|nr:uncharacterized protein KY384_000898 [Bacidia gigantensis]KAG8534055.1 hypothetical protein KY384_000898 [Bacidia gigantensis]